MSKPAKIQILERARALIEDERHWCRGDRVRAVANAELALGFLEMTAHGLLSDPEMRRNRRELLAHG